MTDVESRVQALHDAYPVWIRRTIGSHFDQVAAKYADRLFIYTLDRQYTYADAREISDLLARGFLALGVKPRQHVAMVMGNYAETVLVKLALYKIGAVAVPFNVALQEQELAFVLKDSDAVKIVLHDNLGKHNYAEMLGRICPELSSPHYGDDWFCEAAPKLRQAVCLSLTGRTYPGMIAFDELYRLADSVSPEQLAQAHQAAEYPDDICDIMYTSGTTGLPKGAMLSHDNLLRGAYSSAIARALEDGRRIYFPLPMYHIFAVTQGILAPTFVGGAMVPQAQFAPREALELIEKSRANDILCVPAIALALLNHPDLKKYDLSSLRAMMCASTPAPVSLWQRIADELKITELCTAYGMTEQSGASTVSFPGETIENLATRVGRLIPVNSSGMPEFGGHNIQFKVVDPFTGEDLPPGSEGEWVSRGNMITRGYYKRPEENSELIDKDGWLRTGDLGIIHPDGQFQLTGRSKEIFKCSGENVAPKEVENVISSHPKVNQVYVVGVPDAVQGEVGTAFIELRPGQECTRREIIEHCKTQLARYKVPHHYFFVTADELPFTSSGKVQKYKLISWASQMLHKEGRQDRA